MAAGIAYLAAMAMWVYLVADTPRSYHSPWDDDSLFFGALGAHFVVGLLIGRFWALGLPLAAAFLAIPAGYAYGEHAGEFDLFPVIPIWAGILLASLILIPVMIPGTFLGAWIPFRTMGRGQHASRAQGAS